MQHATRRTLLVATSSVGLVLGGALSAGAHERDGHHGGHDQNWGKGWVRVCQTVKTDRWDSHDGGWNDGRDGRNDGSYTKDHRNGYDDPNSKIDNRYRYGDDNRDRHGDRNSYEGRYLVRDSRGIGYWVTLTGRQDCETVRVNKGWAKVSVVNSPDNTRLTSDRSVWVKVRKYDTASANFTFQAKRYSDHQDHHDYSSRR